MRQPSSQTPLIPSTTRPLTRSRRRTKSLSTPRRRARRLGRPHEVPRLLPAPLAVLLHGVLDLVELEEVHVRVVHLLAERVLVVLLSRHPFYYHAKLLVVLFITYFDGAEYLYRRLRRLRYRVAHSSAWRKRLGPLFLPRYLHEDVSAETYAQRKARAEANAVLKLEQQAAVRKAKKVMGGLPTPPSTTSKHHTHTH